MAIESLRNLRSIMEELPRQRLIRSSTIGEAASDRIQLCDQFLAAVPRLRRACEDFFHEWTPVAHPREWMEYGIRLHTAHLTHLLGTRYQPHALPHHAAELWPMWYDTRIPVWSPAVNQFLEHTVPIIQEAAQQRRYRANACNDKDVRRIHEGQECDDMWSCSLCVRQEMAWENVIQRRYETRRDVFLNPNDRAAFLEASEEYAAPLLHTIPWPPSPSYSLVPARWNEPPVRTGDRAQLFTSLIDHARIHSAAAYHGKTAAQRWESVRGDVPRWIRETLAQREDLEFVFGVWDSLHEMQFRCEMDRLECEEVLEALT